MARLAATVMLLLSLLAVANCRVLEAELPETVVNISDEREQSRRGAFPCHGDARVHPAVLSFEEPMEAALEAVVEQDIKKPLRADGAAELEAVAEPDPDTRPDTDGEQLPVHGEDDGEENESAKAWRREMVRRIQGHGPHFHHSHHHHEQAVEKDDRDDQEQQAKDVGAGGMHIKLFRRRFHHRHHGEEEQDETATKHYFHHHHDSDNEVDEVEELARRLSRAIMRRSLGRGGIRHHHLHRHHAEEGGVRKWFMTLLNMNRV